MDDLTSIPGVNVAFNTVAALADWPAAQDSIMTRISTKEWAGNMTWNDVPLHIRTYLNCSDTFFWGSADAEDVTEENFHILEGVLADLWLLRAVAYDSGETEKVKAFEWVVSDLFAARVREMRPQGAVYTRRYASIPEVWPMFDAAGPERETGIGNPVASPTL